MSFKVTKLVNGSKLIEDITHGARRVNHMHKGIILDDPNSADNKGKLVLFDADKAHAITDNHNALVIAGLHSIIAFIQPIDAKDFKLMSKKHKTEVKKYIAQLGL